MLQVSSHWSVKPSTMNISVYILNRPKRLALIWAVCLVSTVYEHHSFVYISQIRSSLVKVKKKNEKQKAQVWCLLCDSLFFHMLFIHRVNLQMILIRYVEKRWVSRDRKVEPLSSITREQHVPLYKPAPTVSTPTRVIVHLPERKQSSQPNNLNNTPSLPRVLEHQVLMLSLILC